MAAIGRVEGRLAHQAVHTRFGAQEAIGVFALDLDGGGLDAGHFTVGLFQDFSLEALALAVAQILAQQHGSPVLGFGTAGTGLDVDEAVVGVHGAAEHAAEFHVFDQLLQGLGIGFDGDDGVLVLFLACHLEEVTRIGELAVDLDEGVDDRFQRFLFLAEVLGPLLVVPDVGVFQFGVDLFEFLRLHIEVKDTSEARWHGWPDHRARIGGN